MLSYAKTLLHDTETGAHVSTSQADCEKSAGDLRPQGQGRTCGPVWDGWLCWPPTLGGATIRQPCPDVHGFNSRQFAFRHCHSNGTWAGAPVTYRQDQTGWSNYSLCVISSPDTDAILPAGSHVTSAGYDATRGGHFDSVQSSTAMTQLIGVSTNDVELPLDDVIGSGVHAVSAVCLVLALVTWLTLKLTDRLVTRRYMILIATIVPSFLFHVIVLTSRMRAVAIAMTPTPSPNPQSYHPYLPPSPLRSLPIPSPLPFTHSRSEPPLTRDRPLELWFSTTAYPLRAPRHANEERMNHFQNDRGVDDVLENGGQRLGVYDKHISRSINFADKSTTNLDVKMNENRVDTKLLQDIEENTNLRTFNNFSPYPERSSDKLNYSTLPSADHKQIQDSELSNNNERRNLNIPPSDYIQHKHTDSTNADFPSKRAKMGTNENRKDLFRDSFPKERAKRGTNANGEGVFWNSIPEERAKRGTNQNDNELFWDSTPEERAKRGTNQDNDLFWDSSPEERAKRGTNQDNNLFWDTTSEKDESWVTLCEVGRAFYLLSDLSMYAFTFSMSIYYTLVVLGKKITFSKLVWIFVFGIVTPVIFVVFIILLYTFLPSKTGFGSCTVESLGSEFHWATTAPKLTCIILSVCLMSVSTYGFCRLHVPEWHTSSETYYTRQGVVKTLALLLACSAAEMFFLVNEYLKMYHQPNSPYVLESSTALFGIKGCLQAFLFCFLDSEVLHGTCCMRDGQPWLRSSPAHTPRREGGENGGVEFSLDKGLDRDGDWAFAGLSSDVIGHLGTGESV